MKSIRYIIVCLYTFVSFVVMGQEASIFNKYAESFGDPSERSVTKKKWPSNGCLPGWQPSFFGTGIPSDYKLYFSFDDNSIANNSMLLPFQDKYMQLEFYWKDNSGNIIPGYYESFELENPLNFYLNSNSTIPHYFQCSALSNPPNGCAYFKLSFYEPDRENSCGHGSLMCSEEHLVMGCQGAIGLSAFNQNSIVFDKENYICQNGIVCQYIDNFKATKSANDLLISTYNLTNAVFQSIPNTYAFMLEIKGINGSQTETRTIEVQDILNVNIEDWTENLEGFGDFQEYRIKMFYLPFDQTEYISCGTSKPLIFTSSPQLCEILNLLKYTRNGNNLNWNFDDNYNTNYFQEQLNQLGFTLAQAQSIYQNVTAIDFDLVYKENGVNKTKNIHHVVGQNNLNALNLVFENLDFIDLEGKLKITYYYNIDGIQECQFLPFEFKIPKPGVGDLKKYECGVTYPQNTPDPNNIVELQINDIVTVNGITFKISTISGTGLQPRSGTGIISLPFSNKNVLITFSNVVSDTSYNLVTGIVQGVPGDPSNYPGFNLPVTPLNIGGEICLPDPPKENEDDDGFDNVTGLNERGFDSNGIHENGTPYDNSGFDKDGKHKNGTPFDECGCDFDGLDKDKKPCPPCVNEKDIAEYIKENKEKINRSADSLLQKVLLELNSKLQSLDCVKLSTKVQNYVTTLGYNSDYILGKQNIYAEPGLSTKFNKEPEVAGHRIEGKNPLTDSLEVNHVKLYHCDKLSLKYNGMISALSISKAEIEEYINGKMKLLTVHQVNTFKQDPNALLEWLKTTLNDLAESKGINGLGFIETPNEKNVSKQPYEENNSNLYNATASIEEVSQNDIEFIKKEKIWLFNQGQIEIDGVNRGAYLEELFNQMQIEQALAGEEANELKMPLVIKKVINGSTYAIYLDNLELGAAYGKVDAYFVYTPQQSTNKIILYAKNLSFGPGGLIGNVQLKTLRPIEVRLNNSALLRIKPTDKTYVEWDCKGFNAISIDGQMEFCRNVVVPLDPTTYEPLHDTMRYQLDFQVSLSDWKQFYLAINQSSANSTQLKPFAIYGHESIKWTLKDLVIDLSEIQSPTNITLPAGYSSPYYSSTLQPTWKGVSLGLLRAKLPFKFSTSNANVEAEVANLIIDEYGVTTKISAINIVSLNNGSLAGWPLSVDTVNIVIINSQLQGGGIAGKVKVPILKDPLRYVATMKGSSQYSFTVMPSVNQKIDMFLADVVLEKTSKIEIAYINGDYIAKASLDGGIEVNFAGTNMKGISFKKLEVSNVEPYFSPGEWGMGASVGLKLFGFGINMKNINMGKVEDQPALHFDLDLNLVEALELKAGGGFDIVGKKDFTSTHQNWSYDRLEVNSFFIDVSFSAGHIKGSIKKFNAHPTYGEGFNGSLDFDIKALGEVKAIGQFGRTSFEHNEDYKYMYIDASATLKMGIQAGPITIEGFTGGVSYHMTQVFTPNNNAPPLSGGIPPLGASLSGSLTYNPTFTIGLGFKAGALISLAKSKAMFNGSIDIAFEFNEPSLGGGLNNIALNGVGRMMNLPTSFAPKFGNTKLDVSKKPDDETAALSCHLRIQYNFDKKELHGKFITFLNAGVIKGAGNGDKMVDAEIHFSSSLWYIYIGKPESQCGIKLTIPGVGDLTIKGYIDAGTDIPGMPPIPDKVKAIAYSYKEDNTFRKSGSGFIFGASFEFAAKIDFGIGSASVEALVGFDVGLMDFNNVTCDGKQVGIDGWYAKGQ